MSLHRFRDRIQSLFRPATFASVETSLPSVMPVHDMVGRKYELRPDSRDPFPAKKRSAVTVLEVRGGWVRYAYSSIFTDERMELDTFVKIFRPC